MPEKKIVEKARRDKRQGKSPSTQAGEFVRDQIEKIRHGEHGARSAKQAIAIGLSKARRAGVRIPKRGRSSKSSSRTSRSHGRPSPARARATRRALKREGRSAASHSALSRQARSAAKRRSAADRSAAARKAARTRAAE